MRRIVLASPSPYRRELMERLGLPFEAAAPRVEESPIAGEPPAALVRRLAESKARAVAAVFPNALIVGADQVAGLDGERVGMPGKIGRAHV